MATENRNYPDVRLETDGTLYGGWTSVSVRRGLDQLAGTFELAVTERWPGQDTPRPIQPGAACRVLIDGEPVITGYVDDVQPSYDATSHKVTVSGRDKTGDLVDCCPPSTQLKGASFAGVAQTLAAPFGIEVEDRAGAGSVPELKTNPGDTVYDALEQLARAKGVMLTTDGRGRLIITRAGSGRASTVLRLGGNILEARGSFSMRERFSEITVIGQTSATPGWNGAAAAHPKTVARDAAVPRHRPLTLVAEQEHQGTSSRAQWEINSRYGKGSSYTCTVCGWKDGEAVWSPNTLVEVRDPFMGLAATWLIGSVCLTMDDRGCRAELTLGPPEAFTPEPVQPPQRKKGKGGTRWPGATTTSAAVS